jgi:hypothetical protein
VPEPILCPLRTSVYQPGCSKSIRADSDGLPRLILGDDRGVAGVRPGLASPGYLSWFPFSALPNVASYCLRGGVRVVSISYLYQRHTLVDVNFLSVQIAHSPSCNRSVNLRSCPTEVDVPTRGCSLRTRAMVYRSLTARHLHSASPADSAHHPASPEGRFNAAERRVDE